jgi:hypothetical protein
MRILRRAVRIREHFMLPNGDRLAVDVNVEADIVALNRLLNNVLKAAEHYGRDPQDTGLQRAFNDALRGLLQRVLGSGNYKRMVDAYDGDAVEAAGMMDAWIAEVLVPKMREVHERKAQDRKREGAKTLKKARRRA